MKFLHGENGNELKSFGTAWLYSHELILSKEGTLWKNWKWLQMDPTHTYIYKEKIERCDYNK